MNIAAVEAEFSAKDPNRLRDALDRVGEHKGRGPKKSHSAVTGNGDVKNGLPKPGVKFGTDGSDYVVRFTFVESGKFYWDELTMNADAFPPFIEAMRDLLR